MLMAKTLKKALINFFSQSQEPIDISERDLKLMKSTTYKQCRNNLHGNTLNVL